MEAGIYFRLTLVRDLAVRGDQLLQGPRHGSDAIRGFVQLDQAMELGAGVALDVGGRQRQSDKFKGLLDALPELSHLSAEMADLHVVRNKAQHQGIVPTAGAQVRLRQVAIQALSIIFRIAGSDFERFSSIAQIQTAYFRQPLERGLSLAASAPADAAALVARSHHRLVGWAKYLIGGAMIPDEMWVYDNEPFQDLKVVYKCEDSRQDFVDATLSVAAGQALGISVAKLARLAALMRGHRAWPQEGGAYEFEHGESASSVTPQDAEWMVELLARTVVHLEEEWPEYLLITEEAPAELEGPPDTAGDSVSDDE